MRRIVSLFVWVMLVTTGIAQTITGTIRESSSNDAIPYATISLLQSDSSLIAGAISNDNGHFQLQSVNGTYILRVSYVGYNTAYRDIQVDKAKLALGDIYLSQETTEIAEVEVKADRPLIQRQMDKLVMNVSNTPFAVGFSGEEILKKAPGVVIDKDGNVTVNGKSVSVYIDGRPSYLSGESLKSLLEGTDAATIDKIEIITHPSAKYDAAGEGGAIINIKLKKNKTKGTNGTLSATYGGMYFKEINKYFNLERFSFSLNHRSEHTYTSLSLNQSFNQFESTSMSFIRQPYAGDTLFTYRSARNVNIGQSYDAKLSTDWYIDEANTLGFIFRAPSMWIGNGSFPEASNRTVLIYRDDTVQYVGSEGKYRNIPATYNANVNYTHVFNDSLSRELTIEATYVHSDNRYSDGSDYTIYSSIDSIVSPVPNRLEGTTRQKTNRYIVKADFQTAFWKTGMIECGAKWQLNAPSSSMTLDSVMPAYSSSTYTAYDYAEHVAALYITVAKQFGEHWNAKLGLRGELTATRSTYRRQEEQRDVTRKPYANLFPSVYVGYNPTDKWSLSLDYSRNIWRPGVWYLNPFIEYVGAHEYNVGNPDLKPEFSNSVDFNVGWSRYVSVNLMFSHTNGIIEQKPELQDNGDIKYSPVNFGTNIWYGASLALTELPIVPKFKTNDQGVRELDGAWLALTVNAGVNDNMSIADASVDSNYGKRHAFHAYCYGTLTAYLPKDWQIGTDIAYMSPYTSAYDSWSGGVWWDGSVKKSWPDSGVTLTLSVHDIPRSSIFKSNSVGLMNGLSTSSDFIAYSQRVNIGITWNFGKFQQHKYRHVGDAGDDGGKKSSNPGGK